MGMDMELAGHIARMREKKCIQVIYENSRRKAGTRKIERKLGG
jgi:hypothetical protein